MTTPDDSRRRRSDVTQVLARLDAGDTHAANDLLPLVYDELRILAEHQMRHERSDHTLQATALVHEAFLRLVGNRPDGDTADETDDTPWNSRGHFFGAAAEAMRRILIDHARAKATGKRGGNWNRLRLDAESLGFDHPPDELMALDEALSRLESDEPELALLVKLRFFCGLSIPHTALALGTSVGTVRRRWPFARAWLAHALGVGDTEN